ncbi:hypothetical protein [Bdellovibrio sp. HCB288]|uniref:hypothetical protein n=1 Tax=Bdellovibrio sp. HCB288 TaxID=3394355 RepID=UPI0039B5EE75
MRNSFSFLFCLILLFSGPVHAGPLEALSEQAYKLTGKKCAPITTSKINSACEPASENLKKSSQELGKISQSISENQEDRYFKLLAEQQGRELQCASDFAKSAAKEIENNFPSSDLKSKMTMARFARQKAQELGKKIINDPTLSTPVCPQSFEALEGQYPKGTTKGASYKACKEWIGYRQSYQAILSSIPLSGSPSLKKVIEDYASAKDEEPLSQLQSELKNAYSSTQQTLDSNRDLLQKTLKEQGADGLDRAARNELLSDPALSAAILKSNPTLEEVACFANARYGEGADNLNNSVMVGSLLMGGGAAILGKVGAATARAVETSTLARTTGMVSLNGMKILRTTAVGADFASMAAVTHQACFSEKLSTLKSANACVSAPSAEQAEKDNCLLSASLLALGAMPQSLVNELSSHIKTMVADEKRKALLDAADNDWKSVASATSSKTPIQTSKNISPMEKQLTEGIIISRKPVGEGAFGAQFVKYDNGMEGVWKATDNSWVANTANNEVAAYQVDKYLGLKSVPVTVKKELNGREGTVQYRVKELKKLKDTEDYEGDPAELGFLDYLIANGDRHGRNYLQKSDGKVVAIDHGLAFDTGKSTEPLAHFNNRVDRLEKNLKKQSAITARISQGKGREAALKQELKDLKDDASELQMNINAFMPQQQVVEKLRKTTAEDWRKVVGDNLSDKQIEALQRRQMLLLRDIDDAAQRIGKDRLYPAGDNSPLLKTMDSYD